LMMAQNGEQPVKSNPAQSSDDARNPKGIIARSSARLPLDKGIRKSALLARTMFFNATESAAIVSSQNGAASSPLISVVKSMANLTSKMAAMTIATHSSAR